MPCGRSMKSASRGQSLANEISLQGDHIEGRVFREKMPLREQDENNRTRMAFPLAAGRNNPQGLVTIYNYAAAGRDWEIQLFSYLNRGARALFESELRQRQKLQIQNQDLQIQRKAELLYLLYRASTLIQTIGDLGKALHLVLTTVTAHFGLRFNRAWIFMVNENKPLLEGACAVGELSEKDAYRTWGQVSSQTADEFIESLLHSPAQELSQIDQIVKSISLPLATRPGRSLPACPEPPPDPALVERFDEIWGAAGRFPAPSSKWRMPGSRLSWQTRTAWGC